MEDNESLLIRTLSTLRFVFSGYSLVKKGKALCRGWIELYIQKCDDNVSIDLQILLDLIYFYKNVSQNVTNHMNFLSFLMLT